MNTQRLILTSILIYAQATAAARMPTKVAAQASPPTYTSGTVAGPATPAQSNIPTTLLNHMDAHRYAQAWAMFDAAFQAKN